MSGSLSYVTKEWLQRSPSMSAESIETPPPLIVPPTTAKFR